MGQLVWFTWMQEERLFLYMSIVLFALVPISGMVTMALLWFHKRKYPIQYELVRQ